MHVPHLYPLQFYLIVSFVLRVFWCSPWPLHRMYLFHMIGTLYAGHVVLTCSAVRIVEDVELFGIVPVTANVQIGQFIVAIVCASEI